MSPPPPLMAAVLVLGVRLLAAAAMSRVRLHGLRSGFALTRRLPLPL